MSPLKNRLVRSLRNSTVWTKAVPDPPDGGESSRSIWFQENYRALQSFLR